MTRNQKRSKRYTPKAHREVSEHARRYDGCRKIGYMTKQAAKLALRAITPMRRRQMEAGTAAKGECSVYRCPIPGCAYWHLSSARKFSLLQAGEILR